MKQERRKNRSASPAAAARLYLEHLAEGRALAALALADRDGLLVAGTGGRVHAEAIAAVAPLYAQSSEGTDEGLLKLVTRGELLRVRVLRLGDEAFYLAVVGAGEAPGAEEAEEALGRILGGPAGHC